MREFAIEFDEFLLIRRHVFFGKNRGFRAFRDADRAVDALIGIDDDKIGAFAEAVDGADIDAVGTLAVDAAFANNVSHGIKFS